MADIKERILVIRLGALGDLVFCFQAFQDIRQAHPDAEIALLTRAPFAGFAQMLPWFDRVIVETHPGVLQWGAWWHLAKEIKFFVPTRIYDLQGKNRQSILYFLLGRPEWSGAVSGCAFPRPQATADMHFTDFLAAQLRVAQVPAAPKPDMEWLDAPLDKFALPARYAIFIPGCSPSAPHKRWAAEKFSALAKKLQVQDFACIAVGTETDSDAVASIKQHAPGVMNLCGRTSLFELGAILRRASLVVGNDTGPLHMAAAVGAPVLALFSGRSSPVWSKPPGDKVTVLQTENLNDLDAEIVSAVSFDALEKNARRGQ